MYPHKHAQSDIEQVASELLTTKNLRLVSCKTIQSLWAGYGHICQIQAQPTCGDLSKPISLILKYITPPPTRPDQSPGEGHIRKVLSYKIEQFFYTQLAPSMPRDIALASCLASIDAESESSAAAMIVSDLRGPFPVAGEKRAELNETQVYAALDWLACFHGFWWKRSRDFDRGKLCRPPLEHFAEHGDPVLGNGGVWLNGGYTYLATRRDEYRSLQLDATSEWSSLLCSPIETHPEKLSIAELVARFLSPAPNGDSGRIFDYETLIHGDVKSENLFTTADGSKVAFFDFQYVGLGLGVCDLAKLFTSSVPFRLLCKDNNSLAAGVPVSMDKGEEMLLKDYLARIQQSAGRVYRWDVFIRHWETVLVDWLRFQASWGFWGNTEWLEARVRSILDDSKWREWLREETG